MVPNGWGENSLADIVKEKISYGIVQAGPHIEGGIPYIKSSDVKGIIIPKTLQCTSEEIHYKYRRSAVHPGDIVFSLRGNIGESAIVPETLPEANLTQGTARISVGHNHCNLFYYYQLQSDSLLNRINALSKGSTFKEISLEELRKVKVLSPPYTEQNKIAQILSTWDQAISATEKLIESSQKQKKALMQQLLTGKKRLLDENGVRFVGEWEKVHIKDCAECLDNKRVPLNSEQRSLMSGSIPYWGANGIVDYISDFIFDETIVLLAEDGGYFDEYQTRPISNISYGKCWVNNHAHILRAKKNSLNEWIYYCLVHKNILAFVNGGTRAKLNKSDMLMIPLLLPSLQEQKKIVSLLSLADQEIENLQKKLDCLKQEKKSLMQQLLTGKKRVKVVA
ncbi:restriction endonuclease subunit S [Acinetobacter baumannii]|uniref:restriction endonuclease subunit S n=1 Tax=Acinetobacter calcoaceticus/baumannii complex TaxID=909768 RepID=UPI0030BD99FE|nr:restriction endonuclease subunit S [Acinetobacter baumannii]